MAKFGLLDVVINEIMYAVPETPMMNMWNFIIGALMLLISVDGDLLMVLTIHFQQTLLLCKKKYVVVAKNITNLLSKHPQLNLTNIRLEISQVTLLIMENNVAVAK